MSSPKSASKPNHRKNLRQRSVDEKAEKAKRLKTLNATLLKILKKPDEDLTLSDRELLDENDDLVHEIRAKLLSREERKDRTKECEDDLETLKRKCAKLAEAIAKSKRLVVYTGAGISTSANIPDYRGPNGVWTLLDQGKEVQACDLGLAQPTVAHMALLMLYRQGKISHIVSQNCDGLHLRSGIPRSRLSEVHGNMFIEVCKNCRPVRPYVRLFDVTERTNRFRHNTYRRCYICGHGLTDTIVHFGERGSIAWPINWNGASRAAEKADMILCLGSSLKVLRRYTWLWCMDRPQKQRPPLYIVNLQWTPKDSAATLKLNGRCDFVMAEVLRLLRMRIPEYTPYNDPLLSYATHLNEREEHTTTRRTLIESRPVGFSHISMEAKVLDSGLIKEVRCESRFTTARSRLSESKERVQGPQEADSLAAARALESLTPSPSNSSRSSRKSSSNSTSGSSSSGSSSSSSSTSRSSSNYSSNNSSTSNSIANSRCSSPDRTEAGEHCETELESRKRVKLDPDALADLASGAGDTSTQAPPQHLSSFSKINHETAESRVHCDTDTLPMKPFGSLLPVGTSPSEGQNHHPLTNGHSGLEPLTASTVNCPPVTPPRHVPSIDETLVVINTSPSTPTKDGAVNNGSGAAKDANSFHPSPFPSPDHTYAKSPLKLDVMFEVNTTNVPKVEVEVKLEERDEMELKAAAQITTGEKPVNLNGLNGIVVSHIPSSMLDSVVDADEIKEEPDLKVNAMRTPTKTEGAPTSPELMEVKKEIGEVVNTKEENDAEVKAEKLPTITNGVAKEEGDHHHMNGNDLNPKDEDGQREDDCPPPRRSRYRLRERPNLKYKSVGERDLIKCQEDLMKTIDEPKKGKKANNNNNESPVSDSTKGNGRTGADKRKKATCLADLEGQDIVELEYRTIEWPRDALYFSYEPCPMFLGTSSEENSEVEEVDSSPEGDVSSAEEPKPVQPGWFGKGRPKCSRKRGRRTY